MVVGGCSTPTKIIDLLPTYEFVQAWGDSGSGNGQFFYPQGVAVDGSGNVYVVDTANRRIQKFTGTGDYLTQWGTAGSGDGQFDYMNSVAVDASGHVYVADAGNNRIQKFTSDGTYVTQWGTVGSGDGEFGYPDYYWMSVAVGASGNVYVADTPRHRIQKFTGAGTYLAQWGTLGRAEGQFLSPQGVATGPEETVYVADAYHVQVFTSTGEFVTRWAIHEEGFSASEKATVDANGNVYVTDTYCDCIKKFDASGRHLGRLRLGPQGWIPSVAVAASGNLYVTDTENNRIQKFAPR
jgi:DNA-binding beta-propeller fold protein YncE